MLISYQTHQVSQRCQVLAKLSLMIVHEAGVGHHDQAGGRGGACQGLKDAPTPCAEVPGVGLCTCKRGRAMWTPLMQDAKQLALLVWACQSRTCMADDQGAGGHELREVPCKFQMPACVAVSAWGVVIVKTHSHVSKICPVLVMHVSWCFLACVKAHLTHKLPASASCPSGTRFLGK